MEAIEEAELEKMQVLVMSILGTLFVSTAFAVRMLVPPAMMMVGVTVITMLPGEGTTGEIEICCA